MGNFGEMLRKRRKELRLGLREFALKAEMDPGNLSKIERGAWGLRRETRCWRESARPWNTNRDRRTPKP